MAEAGPAIGPRLKTLRTAHRLSLRSLGALTDLSASQLSAIERGAAEPSITALKRIAAVLDVRLEYFFTDEATHDAEPVARIRRGEGRKLSLGSPGAVFERLTPDWQEEPFEAIAGIYEPGAAIDEDSHEGFEWGLVLSGRFKIWVGSQVLFGEPGDCFSFRSRLPHRIQNISSDVGEYIWIDSPPTF